MTLAEVHSRPLIDFVKEVTRISPEIFLKKMASRERFRRHEVEDYLNLGGIRERIREVREARSDLKESRPMKKILGKSPCGGRPLHETNF